MAVWPLHKEMHVAYSTAYKFLRTFAEKKHDMDWVMKPPSRYR